MPPRPLPAAVQFVLSGSLPSSSYVVPTQQLVLATYLFLLLLALEAILVRALPCRRRRGLCAAGGPHCAGAGPRAVPLFNAALRRVQTAPLVEPRHLS